MCSRFSYPLAPRALRSCAYIQTAIATPARNATASTEKTVSQNDSGRPFVPPEPPPPQPRFRAPSATSASSPSTPSAITAPCAPRPPPRRFTGSTPGLCTSDQHGERLALGLELRAL